MHPANQRLGKPDKLSQGAHKQTSYPRVQWRNTLDKRGSYRTPDGSKRERRGSNKAESKREGNVRVKEQSRI